MALKGNPNIDIPLDGVGAQPDAVRRSRAPIDIPLDGRGDDPAQGPVVRLRGHANLLFTNWLNYYVYQETPFRREDIKHLGSL